MEGFETAISGHKNATQQGGQVSGELAKIHNDSAVTFLYLQPQSEVVLSAHAFAVLETVPGEPPRTGE